MGAFLMRRSQICVRLAWMVAAVALFTNVLASSEASARVIVREKTHYYKVSGIRGDRIYAEMARKGPVIGAKKGYLASTAFALDIRNLKLVSWGKQCLVQDVDVVLTASYTIPEWVDEQDGSPALRAAWRDFIAYIWRHERHHVAIAKAESYRFARLIESQRGDLDRDCAGWGDDLKKKAEVLAKDYRARQAALDGSHWGDGGSVSYYDLKLQAAK